MPLLNRFLYKSVVFLQIQLLLNLTAFPILIAWGMPISLMSIIGNLFFGPFLVLFLSLSALIFFTEILSVPNDFIIYLLEKLTDCWIYFLNFGDSSGWLVYFPIGSYIFLFLPFILMFFFLQYKKTNGLYSSTIVFLILLVFYLFFLKSVAKSEALIKIKCNNGEVIVFYSGERLLLIDPGFLGQRSSSFSWIEFSLFPMLSKKTGRIKIDSLILLRPGKLLFDVVCRLILLTEIKEIYLIKWETLLTAKEYYSFNKLKKMIENKNISLKRLENKKTRIKISSRDFIEVDPLNKFDRKKKYPLLKLKHEKFEIYSK